MNQAMGLLGERLKAERERRELSIQKAADGLHLDAWVIEALEGADYARIGPSVYVKGHLKHYAENLGLPIADVMAAYDAPAPQPQAAEPADVPATQTGVAVPAVWPRVAVAFVAAVAVLVGFMGWHHRRAPSGPVSAAVEPPAPPPAAGPQPGAAPPGVPLTAFAAPAIAPTTSPLPALPKPLSVPVRAVAKAAPERAHGRPMADGAAGSGRARLRLKFSADSWVDVRDAAGQRVFAGDGRANSVKTIAGDGPLRVYLRDASSVQLEINDHAVAIGRQYLVGNVAHFEAGADGVLRRDSHTDAPRPGG